MWQNVIRKMLKIALVAVAALLIQALTYLVTSFHPEPGMQTLLWQLLVPALMIAIEGLRRWATYDPAKDPKAMPGLPHAEAPRVPPGGGGQQH
jgi:hypothetical protein